MFVLHAVGENYLFKQTASLNQLRIGRDLSISQDGGGARLLCSFGCNHGIRPLTAVQDYHVRFVLVETQEAEQCDCGEDQ
jgi:hypothetical protein